MRLRLFTHKIGRTSVDQSETAHHPICISARPPEKFHGVRGCHSRIVAAAPGLLSKLERDRLLGGSPHNKREFAACAGAPRETRPGPPTALIGVGAAAGHGKARIDPSVRISSAWY